MVRTNKGSKEKKSNQVIFRVAQQVDNISNYTSHANLETLRTMYEKLEEGLPSATSGDVLSSRVKW